MKRMMYLCIEINKFMKEKMTFREWSAAALLAVGVGLSVAGFCVPPIGEISDSVLWFFAQCCIYAGSVLGVSVVMNRKFANIKDELKRQGIKTNE